MKIGQNEKAIFYMCMYALTQSIVWVLVRQLSSSMSIETVFFFRNLMGFIILSPFIFRNPSQLFQSKRMPLHGLRAFATLAGGLSIFYAVSLLPLSTVVAVTFLAPIFASIAAVAVLKEAFHRITALALVLAFGGVLVISNPTIDVNYTGLLFAFISAVTTALAFITVKILSKTEDANTIVALPFIFVLPVSAIIAWFSWTTPDMTELVLLIFMGLGFTGAQYFMTKAFSLGSATSLLPYDFLRFFFAVIFGVMLFNEGVDVSTIAGALIILSAAILNTYGQSRAVKSPQPARG
jgi:drug/metabolite transporter (DMT)-like permease